LPQGPRFNLCQEVVELASSVSIVLSSVPPTSPNSLDCLESIPDIWKAGRPQTSRHSLVLVIIPIQASQEPGGDGMNRHSVGHLGVGADVVDRIQLTTRRPQFFQSLPVAVLVHGASHVHL
jgi:hypothetical protein